MNPKTLESHLADYFGDRSLSPASANRLAALARATHGRGAQSSTLGPWRYAIAACLGLLVISVALQVASLARPATAGVIQAPGTGSTRMAASEIPTEIELMPQSGARAPRLVALQFHMEGCPYTAETTPVFAELMRKYGDRDVIFTQYDITDPGAAQRSAKLARAIGVDGVYEGPFQSGVIELVDRETGKVLAVMHRRADRLKFEDALAQALP